MVVTGQLQVDNLVARWALVAALVHLESTGGSVPLDGLFKVADANTGVQKFYGHGSSLLGLKHTRLLDGFTQFSLEGLQVFL